MSTKVKIKLNSPYGHLAVLDGSNVAALIPNGTVGEVVRENSDHSLYVEWPGGYRWSVPQHWFEVVSDG